MRQSIGLHFSRFLSHSSFWVTTPFGIGVSIFMTNHALTILSDLSPKRECSLKVGTSEENYCKKRRAKKNRRLQQQQHATASLGRRGTNRCSTRVTAQREESPTRQLAHNATLHPHRWALALPERTVDIYKAKNYRCRAGRYHHYCCRASTSGERPALMKKSRCTPVEVKRCRNAYHSSKPGIDT